MQLVEGLMPQKSRRSPPLALKRGGRSVGFLAKLPFAAPKSQRALFSDKNREPSLIAKPFGCRRRGCYLGFGLSIQLLMRPNQGLLWQL